MPNLTATTRRSRDKDIAIFEHFATRPMYLFLSTRPAGRDSTWEINRNATPYHSEEMNFFFPY